MANIGNFDATNVKPREAFEPIPPGFYKAMVIASDVVPNSKKNGHLLKLEWQVLEGPHANRRIFQQINVDNPNPKAVEIAQQELSAVCHAAGKLRIQDSQELHNIPMVIKVKIRPAEGDYPANNEVAGVKLDGPGAPATPPQASPAPQVNRFPPAAAATAAPPQQQPAPSNSPPWARKAG